ncbi:MAG: GntR family transcriptional regulator [Acidimicrobiaceae bacterium]|jgi:DNA-binding FadR family transcriptional regulator|nr:MAG: GntR family transcriptional regulator [Acidimicrobiaceae bacterium]
MLWTVDHTAPLPLREQIVTAIRRGIASGDLSVGDPLPPAAELGEALDVDRNTVLAAYRQLRTDGVLEFRRGRGVRVARATRPEPAVLTAVRTLLEVGAAHGLDRDQLAQLIREQS